MPAASDYAEKARVLKEEFDHSFSLPVRAAGSDTEDMLAVRARSRYALRIREIGGLWGMRKILPMPGAPAAFLGLCGIRGLVVPVWDLGALLGHESAHGEQRWLIGGPGAAPWALACEEFEGYFRVPRAEVHTAAGGTGAFSEESCPLGGISRPVLRLQQVLEAVRRISPSSLTRRA